MSKNKILTIIFGLLFLVSVCCVYIISYKPGVVQIQNFSCFENGIAMKWLKTQHTSGYEVQRKTENGQWELLDNTKQISISDKKLDNPENYYYRVRSYKNNKNGKKSYGNWSNTVSADYSPEPIKNINATNENKYVTIHWEETSDVDGYKIYKGTSAKNLKLLATISDTDTDSFTDNKIKQNSEYCYIIKSYKKLNNTTYIISSEIETIKVE